MRRVGAIVVLQVLDLLTFFVINIQGQLVKQTVQVQLYVKEQKKVRFFIKTFSWVVRSSSSGHQIPMVNYKLPAIIASDKFTCCWSFVSQPTIFALDRMPLKMTRPSSW
jgi:hypothetical protein